MLDLARTAQSLALATVPHGGQRSARRNAWAAMSQNAVHARARAEAAQALELASQAAKHPAASAR